MISNTTLQHNKHIWLEHVLAKTAATLKNSSTR